MRRRIRYIAIWLMTVAMILLLIMLIILQLDEKKRVEPIDEDTETSIMYSQDEVDSLLEDAKHEGEVSVLNKLRTALEEGQTVISVLKTLYPDTLVVASSGLYHWVEIDDTLDKNNFNIDNLVIDENGVYSYVVDGEVISKKGIDVSSHQGDIDWNAVAADGVEFVFVRACYRGYGSGELIIDEKCIENIEGAQAAGIATGVYAFSQAITVEEAVEEAETVLNLLEGRKLDLPIVFDVEKLSNNTARMNRLSVDERTAVALAFLEKIDSSEYESMLYHNTEMGAMLIDFSKLSKYDKWFAGYNQEFYWPYEYKIWQYSEKGTVAGIKGSVDLDLMF